MSKSPTNGTANREFLDGKDAQAVRRDPTTDKIGLPASDVQTVTSAGASISTLSLESLFPEKTPGRIGQLNYYDLIEVIGRGGMGIVFKALDTKLHRIVAIKILAPEYASSSEAAPRFLREARTAAAVRHDHVVTIYAVDEFRGIPFLVMEFIVGRSLQQKIDQPRPMSLIEIVRIGSEMAAGLAAAHKQGLVHRDIKPANILLEGASERVKITDFGLARAVDDAAVTRTGHVAGTPQYMSPEQAIGERIDFRSDLFSLGSVLYEMCTGRPAFQGTSSVAVLRRVCDDTPLPIRDVNSDIPDWLVAVIDRLLRKKAEDRFQSAAEVAAVLQNHLDRLLHRSPGVALTEANDKYPGDMVTHTLEATQPGTQATKLTSPSLRWFIIGSVALVLLAGAIIIKITTKDGTVTQMTVPDDTDVKVIRNTPPKEGISPTTESSSVFPPLDPDWVTRVATMAPADQAHAVEEELRKRNPGFKDKMDFTIETEMVIEIKFLSNDVTDLTPLRALKGLKRLTCTSIENSAERAPLTDLSPLRGMKLTQLQCHNTEVVDLSPLEGMPLTFLYCGRTRVSDLRPLQGMPLTYLGIKSAPVTDLTPIKDCPLEVLSANLDVLESSDFLRAKKSLRLINQKPNSEFWKTIDSKTN